MTLVSKSPLGPLQVAIVAVLKADTALATLLGGSKIYDQRVPEQTAYPYLLLGDHLSIPDNDLTSFGRDVTSTIHIWTRTRTNKAGQDIAAAVNELLDHQVEALNDVIIGHKVISIRNTFDQALTDPDPELRHHVLRFRVQTAQTS